MCEVDTGILLKEDGARYQRGQQPYRPHFATLAQAEERRDELLQQFPFAEVCIQNKSDGMLESLASPLWDEYSNERNAWYAWRKYTTWRAHTWLVRKCLKQPPKAEQPVCRHFDPER